MDGRCLRDSSRVAERIRAWYLQNEGRIRIDNPIHLHVDELDRSLWKEGDRRGAIVVLREGYRILFDLVRPRAETHKTSLVVPLQPRRRLQDPPDTERGLLAELAKEPPALYVTLRRVELLCPPAVRYSRQVRYPLLDIDMPGVKTFYVAIRRSGPGWADNSFFRAVQVGHYLSKDDS